jgi:hypothetical protein
MLEKSLHFPIKPGVVAAWYARTVVIVATSDGSSTRVRDVATGKEHDVPVDELQGIPAIGHVQNDERRWALVRDSTRAEWKQARRRERVLNRCILGEGNASARVQFACKALGLSRRSIYRLLATYRAAAQTSTLIQRHCGTPRRADALPRLAKPLLCAALNSAFSADPELRCPSLQRRSKDNAARRA